MNANLYALFATRFPEDMQACAIETGDGLYYCWDDIDRASARLAHLLLASGLPVRSRVAVRVDNSSEAVLLYLAILRAGLVFVPLPASCSEVEVEFFLTDARPEAVVCRPVDFSWLSRLAFAQGAARVFTLDQQRRGSLLQRAASCPDHFVAAHVEPDDVAAVLYSAGGGGRAKGAVLTHGNLASNVLMLEECWRGHALDVLLHALPLCHGFGLIALHIALLGGSKTLLLPHFDAAAVVATLPRATLFLGLPEDYVALLKEPGLNSSVCRALRLFGCAWGALAEATFDRFFERTGARILEAYGMVECGLACANPYHGRRLAGTVGLPLPGVAVRVVDEHHTLCEAGQFGHIQIKGNNVFAGYWGMPELTRAVIGADGWFDSGDVGKIGAPRADNEGYLVVAGRRADLIVCQGHTVVPREVEAIIDAIDGVLESAVIGLPDKVRGETVIAVIVTSSGQRADDAARELVIWPLLKANLAHYKVPERLIFVPALPRDAAGRVQKEVLRARCRQGGILSVTPPPSTP